MGSLPVVFLFRGRPVPVGIDHRPKGIERNAGRAGDQPGRIVLMDLGVFRFESVPLARVIV